MRIVLSPARRALRWAFAAFVLTFCFELLLCRRLIEAYYPSNDELALETVSTSLGGAVHPSRWLTQGFHHFFVSFPEWGAINSDLWRPLANVLFWLHYQLLGDHWSTQLIFGYATHAAVVAVVAYCALAIFELSAPLAGIAVLLAALNPALWSPFPSPRLLSNMLQFPIFQTEMLCALLMLLAVLAFLRSRYLLFALIASLSVCLKETALTVPLSALALVGAWRSTDRAASARHALCLASPILVWCVGKFGLFQYGFTSAVLITDKPLGWLTQPIRNLLLWPTGLYVSPLSATRQALVQRDLGTVFQHGTQVLVNLVCWLALFLVLRVALPVARGWLHRRPPAWLCALLFALGNLALVVALQSSQLRFGYFWFALGPLSMLAALPRVRTTLWFALAIALGMLVPEGVTIRRAFAQDSLRHYLRVKDAARQLTALLHALPPSVQRVYLVDDTFVKPGSPEYLQRFAGFTGEVVLVNSIEPVLGSVSGPTSQGRYRLQRAASNTVLRYLEPPAGYQSDWGIPSSLLAAGNPVLRGPSLAYHFPVLSAGLNSAPNLNPSNLGPSWSVTEHDPACRVREACLWLGFDADARRYYPLEFDETAL